MSGKRKCLRCPTEFIDDRYAICPECDYQITKMQYGPEMAEKVKTIRGGKTEEASNGTE